MDSEGKLKIANSINVNVKKQYFDQNTLFDNVDKFGTSALHHAAQKGNDEEVLNLLKQGYNANLQNKFGLTPLMKAVIFNKLSTAKILLKGTNNTNKANPNIVDNDGNNTALIAASQNNLDMLKLLVEHKVNVLATSKDNSTILHLAAVGFINHSKNWDLIEWLLKNYPEIPLNNSNNDNITVLEEVEQEDYSYAEAYADIVWEIREIDLME